jgi:O-antigen/teichoic acid export membrane protein
LPILFVLGGWGVTGAIIGYIISNVAASALGIYFGGVKGRFKPEIAKKVLSYGFYSALGMISGYVVGKIDRVLLGFFVAAEAIGYYSTATGMADLMILVPAALYTVLFPIISRTHARNDIEKISKIFRSSFVGMAIYVAVAAVGLIYISRPLIQILLGNAYLPAIWIVRITVVSSGFSALGYIITVTLNGIGRPDIVTRISLVHAVVLIVTLPVLAIQIGAMGAVLATIISRIVFLAMGLIETHRLTKIKIDRDAFKEFMGTMREILG